MRVLRELPEIEEKIQSGELNLSLVSQASTFFRSEQVKESHQKREVLQAISGKSVREAQRELVSRATEPEKLIPERVRPISREYSELRLVIDQETLAQIEELRNLLGHKIPKASLSDLIRYGVELALKKHRPKAPKESIEVAKPLADARSLPTPAGKTHQNLRWLRIASR